MVEEEGGYQVSLTIDKSTQLLPYSNIQISFKLSWIESFGSVLVFGLLLACMIQSAQKAKLSSMWHKDHSGTILLPQQVEELSNCNYTSHSSNSRISRNNRRANLYGANGLRITISATTVATIEVVSLAIAATTEVVATTVVVS